MFQLYADKTRLTVRQREPVTSGSVNVYPVRFEFSGDWAGLERTAVFRGGTVSRSVPLDDTGECTIPWEALQKPNVPLEVGVYGTRDGNTVLPTVWANLGCILEGVDTAEETRPPTPGLWDQVLEALAGKQEKLRGRPGQVVGFDSGGNAVAVDFEVNPATDEEVREMLDEVFGSARQ